MTSAEHSKAMVLLLLTHCLLLPPLFYCFFMLGPCFVAHYLVLFLVLQSFHWGCFILTAFECHLTVSVLCLFLVVPWVGQCVIVACSGHTHFFM